MTLLLGRRDLPAAIVAPKLALDHASNKATQTPFIPAQAGIQGRALGPRNGSPRRERRGVPRAGTNGV